MPSGCFSRLCLKDCLTQLDDFRIANPKRPFRLNMVVIHRGRWRVRKYNSESSFFNTALHNCSLVRNPAQRSTDASLIAVPAWRRCEVIHTHANKRPPEGGLATVPRLQRLSSWLCRAIQGLLAK